jgi:hypothetical protein
VFWSWVYVDWGAREEAEETMLESRRRICAPKGNEGIVNGRAGDMSENMSENNVSVVER